MITLAHAEHARDVGGVRGPGAAEADHGVAARILALLDEVDARGGGHALDDDLVDAARGLLDAEAERLADASPTARRAASRSSVMRPPRKKPGS